MCHARHVTDPDERYRVRSVDRAIDVLELLAGHPRGLNVTDVAAAVSGAKSAVFATLQTLVARDLVHVVGSGSERRYRLGLGLARLGQVALARVSFRDVVAGHLAALSEQTGLTSRAAIWGGDHAIVVEQVNGSTGVRFDLHLGQRETVHRSSVGKALLAALPQDEADRALETIDFAPATPFSIRDIDALRADLETIRRRGYALDDEEDALGIICIGAAVYDHEDRPIGAISVTTVKAGLAPSDIDRLGRSVAAQAAAASAELGYRSPLNVALDAPRR